MAVRRESRMLEGGMDRELNAGVCMTFAGKNTFLYQPQFGRFMVSPLMGHTSVS